jgi:hypothetical protein
VDVVVDALPQELDGAADPDGRVGDPTCVGEEVGVGGYGIRFPAAGALGPVEVHRVSRARLETPDDHPTAQPRARLPEEPDAPRPARDGGTELQLPDGDAGACGHFSVSREASGGNRDCRDDRQCDQRCPHAYLDIRAVGEDRICCRDELHRAPFARLALEADRPAVAAAEPLSESDLIELLEAQARRGSVSAIELLLARRAEAPGKMPPTEMIRSARSTSSPRSAAGVPSLVD